MLRRTQPTGTSTIVEANVTTVTQLGELLRNGDADNTLSRCASLAGHGPRLERQVTAMETDEPQTQGAAALSLSKGENIGLFLTLQKEPLAQSIYLAGIHLTLRKDLRGEVLSEEVVQNFYVGSKAQPFVLLAKTPDDVSEIRRQWVRVLHEIIIGVDRFKQGREWREQLSLQAYVLAEEERELLIEWLLVTDDEGGRRAQLEYRDYACRKQLWTGKPQPNLAVVTVCDIQKDKLGTPAKLCVEYAKPFIDAPPEPGQRYLMFPRFTDYGTDGVVEFLQKYGDLIQRQGEGELFLRLLRIRGLVGQQTALKGCRRLAADGQFASISDRAGGRRFDDADTKCADILRTADGRPLR